MTLGPGTKLGPYEIVAPLGAGGMGEVWRARDPRLGRDVAIKALPAAFAQDGERLARFEREARLLASLSHPDIAGILALEDVAGTRYLVLEFVDGETLEARLKRGPLPLDEALDVARQVAAGVEAAHEAGVVHRDLKPGNVMLTASGGVKVLDFGLAKGGGGKGRDSDPNLSASPTMTYAGTQAGVILGTAAYMSPEQARGKAVDRRTDIWSFGCLLYECLGGRRTFDGETVSDMVARILEREPDWSLLPATTPPRLVGLLRRCLVKDARQRVRDIGDVRLELEAIAGGDRGEPPAPTAAAARRGAPAWAVALGAIALVALGALAAALLRPRDAGGASARLVRFTLASPPGLSLDTPAEAEVSPDGRTLVFHASDSLGTSHLCVRPLGSPDARVLPGTEQASLPFWSPDGRMLGFFAQGKLRKVALDGSPPVDLCDAPDGRGGSWSPRGVIVFAPNNQGGLVRVADGGGVPVPVTRPDSTRHERGHRYPQFLPDGRHFLYVAIADEDLVRTFAGSLDGGAPVEICRAGSGARYASPGMLLYLDQGVDAPNRRLLAQRFDPGRLRTEGDARLLLDRVNSNNFGYANVSCGPGGLLTVQHWLPGRYRLTWRDARGAPAGVAADGIVGDAGALSPDGRRFAYPGADPTDLFVLDLATGVSTRLTFEDRLVSSIVWSPDGRRIAFARSISTVGWEARLKNADGSGPDSLLFRGPGLFTFPSDWSHDGAWLLLRCSQPTGDYDIWRMPMNGGGPPTPYQLTPGNEGGASLSPDGRWLCFVTDDGARKALFVGSFPDPGSRYQVTVNDLWAAGWLPGGQALVAFGNQGDVLRIGVSTGDGFQQGATTHLFSLPRGQSIMDVDRATGRFLVRSDIDLSSSTALEVLLGWPRLLEGR